MRQRFIVKSRKRRNNLFPFLILHWVTGVAKSITVRPRFVKNHEIKVLLFFHGSLLYLHFRRMRPSQLASAGVNFLGGTTPSHFEGIRVQPWDSLVCRVSVSQRSYIVRIAADNLKRGKTKSKTLTLPENYSQAFSTVLDQQGSCRMLMSVFKKYFFN